MKEKNVVKKNQRGFVTIKTTLIIGTLLAGSFTAVAAQSNLSANSPLNGTAQSSSNFCIKAVMTKDSKITSERGNCSVGEKVPTVDEPSKKPSFEEDLNDVADSPLTTIKSVEQCKEENVDSFEVSKCATLSSIATIYGFKLSTPYLESMIQQKSEVLKPEGLSSDARKLFDAADLQLGTYRSFISEIDYILGNYHFMQVQGSSEFELDYDKGKSIERKLASSEYTVVELRAALVDYFEPVYRLGDYVKNATPKSVPKAEFDAVNKMLTDSGLPALPNP